MKILYVITKGNWGGAQRYVYDLAVAAKAAGHEVAVAYGDPPAGGGELAARFAGDGIRTIRLDGLARDIGALRELRAFRALLSLFRRERPDIVHLNSSKAGALGALAARLAHAPRIIFTAHGWAFNEDRPLWQKVVIYKLAWLTVFLSHATICVSQAIRRDTRFMPCIRRKLVVIHNGVTATDYVPREEARRALWPGHEDGIWIGMLSELHQVKRIEDAIEAVACVRTLRPDVKLVVLGGGEERDLLLALIKARRLENVVHLAGFVPEGDRYLGAFDLFAQASRSEALATAVIEAGLAGLPIVATAVGGIPEIVEDGVTGLLVPPYTPKRMAEALLSLISDPPGAAGMGAALRVVCRARFDHARMARETLALYARRS